MEIILAVLVSALTQWLKQHMPNQYYTLGLVAVLSLVGAGIYTTLVDIGYWRGALQIMIIAGAIYTYIIARFEGGSEVNTYMPPQG